MAQSVKFQLRRDIAANWAANNPVLAPGEPGFATPDGTTGGNRLKIGTGLTGWNFLPYVDCGTTGATGPGFTGPTGPPGTGGGGGGQDFTSIAQGYFTPFAVPSAQVQIGPTGGTFRKTTGLVAGYDTAIRSTQAYLSGCYVSFNSPTTAGSEVTIGISSTPVGNTGTNVADVQYGINYNQSGTTYGYYESGTSVTFPDACAPGDSFSIVYDGTNVNYYHQNTLVRSVARAAGQTGAFHLEGNFQNYGTVNNLVFGPIGQTTSGIGGWTPQLYGMIPSPIAGTFNTTQTNPAWGVSQVSSVQGFRQAYASFSVIPLTNISSYIGITTTPNNPPSATPNSAGLYAICVSPSATQAVQIYENTTIIDVTSTAGTTLATDVFTVSYDGVNFTYYKNAILLRVSPYTVPAGTFLYLQGQHSQANSSFTNVVFGPKSQQTISTGDVLTTTGPTGTYGPVFYNRNSIQFLTGGPWFWSYRLTAPLTGLNPGNGTGSDGLALGYPAGSFIGPWTIAPPASGYDAYVQEPNGLSMIQNDASNPYTFFYAKISGVYLISFTCWASGGNSSISFMGNGIVYSYAIATTPGGNCTTFMAPLTAGVGYLFIAGGQGAGGGPFNLFTGTQAQFYLLCPT